MTATNDIFLKLKDITSEIGAIGKTNRNEFQKYNFRSIAQALGALQPLLVKHGVVLQPCFQNATILEQEKGCGAIVNLALTFWSTSDNSFLTVHAVGQGADSGDKAMYKAMAGALKYAIFSTFCVPEEGADAEFSEPEVKTTKKPAGSSMKEIFG